MSTARRSVLAAASPAFAPMEDRTLRQEVAELVRRSAEGNAALMRGDAHTYLARVPLGDDFLLMSPFGGEPSMGGAYTHARIDEIGRFFRNGSFGQDLVHSWSTPNMVVLALIERANVEVGGLPAQDWALRVTLVYRRDGSEWHLVHRHADPLAPGITVAQAATLARGTPGER